MTTRIALIFVLSVVTLAFASGARSLNKRDDGEECKQGLDLAGVSQILDLHTLEIDEFEKILIDIPARELKSHLMKIAHDFKKLDFDIGNLIGEDLLTADNKINRKFEVIELRIFEEYMKVKDDMYTLPEFNAVKNRGFHFAGKCISNFASVDWLSMKDDFRGLANKLVKEGLKCLKDGVHTYIEALDFSSMDDSQFHDGAVMMAKLKHVVEITDEARHMLNFAIDVFQLFEKYEKKEITLSDIAHHVHCEVTQADGRTDDANCQDKRSGVAKRGECHTPLNMLPHVLKTKDLEFAEFQAEIQKISPSDLRTGAQKLAYHFKKLNFDLETLKNVDLLVPGGMNPDFRAVELKIIEEFMRLQDDFHQLPAITDLRNEGLHFLGDCLSSMTNIDWMGKSDDFESLANEIVRKGLACIKAGADKYIAAFDLSDVQLEVQDPVTNARVLWPKLKHLVQITDEFRHVMNIIADLGGTFGKYFEGEMSSKDFAQYFYCKFREMEGVPLTAECAAPPTPAVKVEREKMLRSLLKDLLSGLYRKRK